MTLAGDIIYAPGNSNDPVTTNQTADILLDANTSFAPGTSTCSTTFVAPDSGSIYVTVAGHIEQNTSGGFAYMSYEIRTGAVVGSGSVVQAAVTDYGVGIGGIATALTADRISASREKLITGLTPGATYNIRTMHQTTSGTLDVFYRELLIKMVH